MPRAVAHSAQPIAGLATLAERYDGFVVDQWGVLQDGTAAYPGVPECLERLRDHGKRVVILSNSGRRALPNAERLAGIGIPATLYDAIVTSGEATWQELAQTAEPFYAGVGRRCRLYSRGGDRSIVDGLDLDLVESAETADFILMAGLDAPPLTLDDLAPDLIAGARRHLPMVCANPDIYAVRRGGPALAPGAVARRYQAMGGRVRHIGKPWPEIYGHCRQALGAIPNARVVAVGDSLTHDIAGGIAAGFATALITGGLYDQQFAGTDAATARARLDELCRDEGATPDWVLQSFVW